MAKTSDQNKQHVKGRPSKLPGHVPPSKARSKCFCCPRKRRRDKIIKHIMNQVIWVKDSKNNVLLPVNKTDGNYIKAEESRKKHTDYVRNKGLNSDSFKKFIPLVKKGCRGPLDSFLVRKESSSEEEEESSSSEEEENQDSQTVTNTDETRTVSDKNEDNSDNETNNNTIEDLVEDIPTSRQDMSRYKLNTFYTFNMKL